MFDLLYIPVTDHSPVVRLLRTADRAVAEDALDAFEGNDPSGAPEFTYQVRVVPVDPILGNPADGIQPGRPACPVVDHGTPCGSARLTWTPGEVFRCRSCGAEFTGETTGWAPA